MSKRPDQKKAKFPGFMPVVLLLLLVLAGGNFSLNAQNNQPQPQPSPDQVTGPYRWHSVKVGAGGFIPGIVFSRVQRGLAYLRSDMGGAYRWDESGQSWIPLQDGMRESSYFGTESIAPDPIDAEVVYVAAGMYRGDPAAILRSRNAGKTWEVFPVPFRMGGNEDGRGLGERLAVDPSDNRILYFGSRHDGLMRSANKGETWEKVASFPLPGLGLPGRGPTHGGLGFVVFAPDTGQRGSATKTIFVGSADAGDHHLFRSDDAGGTWQPVAGEPAGEMLPAQAQIDDAGMLYITYANRIGPNGVTDGAVWKFDIHSGAWTDITPDQRPGRPRGGYMGISLDRLQPGTLAVATMNRWSAGDTVWRSTDGGQTWADISGKSERDISATPFLRFDAKEARLGWWMAALAIDPFDSNHAAYATGATIFATSEFSRANSGGTMHWSPWVQGIEQTAVITLLSPGEGAHLISGFGDIGGFVHDDLTVSPPSGMFRNPFFGNTNTLEAAGQKPAVIVRSGRPGDGQAPLGYSEDGGHSWQPLTVPDGRRGGGNPAITTSADGQTFMVMTPVPQITRDRGKTWTAVTGLPEGAHPVADAVDAARFHALDFATRMIFSSDDGGVSFQSFETTGLPADISGTRPGSAESPWPLHSTTTKAGDLWLVSRAGLFHSTDGGKAWQKSAGDVRVEFLSFGKAPPGRDYPALFAIGRRGGLRAIWRSDDEGATWLRLNDEDHQWGTRFRCIAGDPRIFGRVYFGTDGRGILYGEPAEESPSR